MPKTHAPLPYKVAFSLGGVEWRVEKLGRVQLDPRRNVRAALFIDGAFSRVATVTPNTRKNRTDYFVHIAELGGMVYLHRLAAYAWRTEWYEDLDGEKKRLPKHLTWTGFSRWHVDHGEKGPSEIILDNLTICTRERNDQLECERKGFSQLCARARKVDKVHQEKH